MTTRPGGDGDLRHRDDPRDASERRAGFREVGRSLWALALPVLPVLAAEPVYLLVDGIVVGRLGEADLAALGVGALVILVLGTQMNFLSYGTTARAARLHGAGRDRDAVAEGVQASWIAIGVGLIVVAAVYALMGPLTRVLASDPEVAAAASEWLRIAVWGIPLILLSAAGNGWLRGLQRTRPPLVFVVAGIGVSVAGCLVLVHGAGPIPGIGLTGSAWANLAGQAVMAGGFVAALLIAHDGSIAPRWPVVVEQLRLGRDLVIRTASFQITFAVATTTAAAAGTASLGAHHLSQQLWSLYTLLLDSLAVAVQALVGAALGAALLARAKAIARAVVWWSVAVGAVLALVTWLARGPLAVGLAGDAAVAEPLGIAIVGIVAILIPAAIVFGLDGVLLGAGDAAYLRTTTILAALCGFLPVLLLAREFEWGLVGIWSGMAVFVVLRLVAVVARISGDRWLVAGAGVPAGKAIA